MRRIEAVLTDENQPLRDLAREVYDVPAGYEATRAEVEAVRRAVKRLAQMGRAEVQTGRFKTDESGMYWRYMLVARQPSRSKR
jgi:hypothetical protein